MERQEREVKLSRNSNHKCFLCKTKVIPLTQILCEDCKKLIQEEQNGDFNPSKR